MNKYVDFLNRRSHVPRHIFVKFFIVPIALIIFCSLCIHAERAVADTTTAPITIILNTDTVNIVQLPVVKTMPAISIIIDDLGNNLWSGKRVLNLPASITCSILPYTPFAERIADAAYASKHEVILHAPMQAITSHRLGKGGLQATMDYQNFITTLNQDLRAVPHVQGLSNHMGSLLTQQPMAMTWLMQTLKQYNYFFIDSVTSPRTIAKQVAQRNGVATSARNVFLDNVHDEAAIAQQFERLLAIARQRGTAVAIGHPYPATLNYLEKVLPTLAQQGYQVVPVSKLIEMQKEVY